MFNVILYQPEIPPNTGNIIRLCANTGCRLHLIHPLGFELSDKQMRRAGLDYHPLAELREYPDWQAFRQQQPDLRLIACSTRGKRGYSEILYRQADGLVFGPETRGLPAEVREQHCPLSARIPMLETSRSLNLSNAVAVVVYEAWRQTGFTRAW